MRRVVQNTLTVAGLALAVCAWPSASAADTLNLTGDPNQCGGTTTCGGTEIMPGYWSFAGLIWSVTDTQPTGSGYIDSFVRIQDAGPYPENLVVDGHNTSNKNLANDEKPIEAFTHDVLFNDLSTVELPDGNDYYQFLLDINQEGGDPILSLSGLQFCTSNTASLSIEDTCKSSDSKLHYDMNLASGPVHPEDQEPLNNVLLDYTLNSGSGSGDLYVYVPTSYFPKTGPNKVGSNFYLWSQFGLPTDIGDNNDGYEEWAFINGTGGGDDGPFNQPGVPEPASLILLGTGLVASAGALRRRNRQRKQNQQDTSAA